MCAGVVRVVVLGMCAGVVRAVVLSICAGVVRAVVLGMCAGVVRAVVLGMCAGVVRAVVLSIRAGITCYTELVQGGSASRSSACYHLVHLKHPNFLPASTACCDVTESEATL